MTLQVLVAESILTMDPSRPEAEVVVVDGDRIVDVGERGLVRRYPQASLVDLGRTTVVPGFIDAHYHLCLDALHPRWANLRHVNDSPGLFDAMTAQARAEPEADWVRGVGWSDLDNGYQPTCRDLDAMNLDRPAIAVHYSYHQCVVSSAGLDALGISASTPDPPGGSIGRFADGSPNGLLVERAFSEAQRRSMASYLDPDRWADLIVTAAHRLVAEGITCVHDAACPPSAEAVYSALVRDKRLPLGVVVMPHPAALLAPLDASRLEGPVTGEGDYRLAVGPIKLFADGGVLPAITGTWQGRELRMGLVFEGLLDQVRTVVERGFRVAVHAIGNAGVAAALDAFEAAERERPGADHRFRIEHASLLKGPQINRMADLGVVGVVQPGFLHHMGGAVQGFAPDDMMWMAFGSLQAAGVVLAASSDAPCAFSAPALTSARGTTRLTSNGTVLDSEQSVPYESWLRAYTAGAAFAGGQEDVRGRIARGLVADLVVLEGPLDAFHPPTVVETWAAGTQVYVASPQGVSLPTDQGEAT
jgi:predicted amidohydrolase YtcJ